ncbi:MAG TPA: dihydrofolate reductase [Pseudomonadota bacterium]|nr:dihydrofolate reductase [Xanthomonadales bacterium]HQW64056.1 dihydrofolate reductase [Pseudomonadota bacterium]HQX23497.1 dihydrofolate reductase [Pseudomonadota bacterium]HQY35322.1 dihydrofolate reductase [Pseudomonadota bacterium]HRA37816.1 dihydrofolate reductase [Pseudomonadota bacterium]
MRITLVAAMDRNRAIGVDGKLPWHLPDDLRRFKALTLGKPVLMGRKTAESLRRALPGRLNLVLTRSGRVPHAGMQAVASLAEALARAAGAELMVIGGGEVYALALPLADRLELTEVDTRLPSADAWFPPWRTADWRETRREAHAADGRHAHAFTFLGCDRILG